jgi:DNA-binding transcriptional LysR family regulator
VIQSLLASDVSDIRFAADETPDFVSYQAFDVAILYGEAAAQHHDLESLGPDVFTPVCHRSVADRIKTAADLMRYPLVVNESNAVSWSDWFEVNGLAAQGGKWLRFNRVAHIIPVLLEGVGIGLESLRLMSPYLERGELLICPLPGTSPISRELTFLHVTRAAGRRPRAEHVARLIRDECATNADGLRRSEAARRPQVEPSSEHGHFSHSGKSPGK